MSTAYGLLLTLVLLMSLAFAILCWLVYDARRTTRRDTQRQWDRAITDLFAEKRRE